MNDAATVTTTSDAQLLGEVLRHALDGIAVVETRDGVTRVAYGNATLAALLRRSEEWVAGHRLEDVEVEAPADPNLTNAGVGSRVRLKRVDGTLVDCERWAVMLSGGRMALYYRPCAAHLAGRARCGARALQRRQHRGATARDARARLVDRPA